MALIYNSSELKAFSRKQDNHPKQQSLAVRCLNLTPLYLGMYVQREQGLEIGSPSYSRHRLCAVFDARH